MQKMTHIIYNLLNKINKILLYEYKQNKILFYEFNQNKKNFKQKKN